MQFQPRPTKVAMGAVGRSEAGIQGRTGKGGVDPTGETLRVRELAGEAMVVVVRRRRSERSVWLREVEVLSNEFDYNDTSNVVALRTSPCPETLYELA